MTDISQPISILEQAIRGVMFVRNIVAPWLALLVTISGCSFGWDLSRLSDVDQRAASEAIREYEDLGCDFTSLVPGRTIVIYYEDLGKHYEHRLAHWSDESASIYVDSAFGFRHDDQMDEPCGDRYDFHETMLHEIGHVAGFDHVQDTSAIMFPRMETCGTRRSIVGREREAMQIACLGRELYR
jgi:hypothetical protein